MAAAHSHDATQLAGNALPYASPSVRLFARELGVDLTKLTGSARGGRISKEDVQNYVKAALAKPAAAAASGGGLGLNLLPWPNVDFSKFGAIETKPLARIKKISGANLARNWAMIPHVTQFDDADITELEAFRVQLNKENEKAGLKLTMLAFLMKAAVAGLKKFPDFNASLDASGEHLTLKQYFHVGFAADTPNGLVVPVIRNAEAMSVAEIEKSIGDFGKKAKDGVLTMDDMKGGTFTISNGGVFGSLMSTPIINPPQSAVLGLHRIEDRPVVVNGEIVIRPMMYLALSYDHRLIDGREAVTFLVAVKNAIEDPTRLLIDL